ncbi:hypothetical protein MOUN0_D02652 [Monosporozyma unispora]|nr:hypothetical protein C6P44_002216 [Kazachstania unispora]
MITDPNCKYCRYHKFQDPTFPRTSIISSSSDKNGFIYIYTYKLLYDSMTNNKIKGNLKWLKVDNSIITNGESTKLIKYDTKDNKGYILCKIGMTTRQNVQSRLNEWETHCHHEVVNLTPEKISPLLQLPRQHSSSLSTLFKKLSIKDKSKTSKSVNIGKFKTYKDNAFFVSSKSKMALPEIESFLHKLFWNKYGRGIIRCSGCGDGQNSKRHMEWFNVPISELPFILHTIDNFIYTQS